MGKYDQLVTMGTSCSNEWRPVFPGSGFEHDSLKGSHTNGSCQSKNQIVLQWFAVVVGVSSQGCLQCGAL